MTEMIIGVCFTCKQAKEIYKNTRSRRCRECNNAYMREYKKRNLEKVKRTHRESRMRIYNDNPTQRLKDAANDKVRRHISSGKIKRLPCEVCGEYGQAHHDSYAKENWLKVRFLCKDHHAEWHRINEPTF